MNAIVAVDKALILLASICSLVKCFFYLKLLVFKKLKLFKLRYYYLFVGRTISRDVPLGEITLRKYEKPGNLSERELIRKICLSVGLLQPGDSRDVVVDVFHTLLNSSKSKKLMSSDEVKIEVVKLRKKQNLALRGIAESNIRRQLKRLRDLFLVEKVKNDYRITEWEHPKDLFNKKIEEYYLESIKGRVKEYFNALK